MEVIMKEGAKPALDRRTFLKRVAVVGSAAAVVTVTGNSVATESIKHSADSESPAKGYQKTSHVKIYYNTARI
jgi:hypothetical protein